MKYLIMAASKVQTETVTQGLSINRILEDIEANKARCFGKLGQAASE